MARITGKDGYIYLVTSNLSGDANEITLTISPRAEDTTTFSDEGDTFAEGKYNWAIEVSAFYESGSGKVDAVCWGCIGAGEVDVIFGPEGSTEGKVKYWGKVILTEYAPAVAAQGGATANFSLQGSGTLNKGTFPA